jgi:hypothetical protein
MEGQNQVKLNVSPDKIEARYSDFALITKNMVGFSFDFGQQLPGSKEVNVISRIALSPQHAKLFLRVLEKNLKEYENEFGTISIPERQKKEDENRMIHFIK